MSKKNTTPQWPTHIAARTRDGRLMGIDQSVWAYFRVPMAPVSEAKTGDQALQAGMPIHAAYEALASMTPAGSGRRSMTRGKFRETHLLLVNVPTLFQAPADNPIAQHLTESFAGQIVQSRMLMFGVKLRASLTSTGWRGAIDSIAETIVAGGTPMSDFDEDFAEVSDLMRKCGLTPLDAAALRLADAWWNHGGAPDVPVLPHSNHLHFFTTAAAAGVAAAEGLDSCESWPTIAGTHTITFANVQSLELPYVDATTPAAKWVVPLLDSAAGVNAAVVSVRALVEPSLITRGELRRQRKGYQDDLNTLHREGKMDRAELDSKLAELGDVEAIYADGNGPATLVDCSVLVGFDGTLADVEDASTAQVRLNGMLFRQDAAWSETMLCSNIRANPSLHDFPAPTIAYSGLPSLNTVGDREGALVGFTEDDRQPAYLSPTAVATEDTYPLCVVAAASGAGKSMMMLFLADQFARMNRPVVIIDPKTGSDFSDAVRASGGQIASLDDLISADGVLDPLRFAKSAQDGVEMAASMVLAVNPFGDDKLRYEVPLFAALNHGVSRGATCIGQALMISAQDGKAPAEMVNKVIELANASSMFRALIGFDPTTKALSVNDGITLIKVGSQHLNLPSPGTDPKAAELSQRIGLAVVRMMMFGAATALTGRDGVIMQDEAWTILNADPKEVERLGRLARSQRVLPVLFSQDIRGAVRAGLTGYISRGFVGPIADPDEARAACELFGIEPTPERMARITARATMDSFGLDAAAAPNWQSMKALRDPHTRQVIRGSVWLYSDLSGRVVPVECTIPPAFLQLASTNAADIDRRKQQAA